VNMLHLYIDIFILCWRPAEIATQSPLKIAI
jgi:hypothetical protein